MNLTRDTILSALDTAAQLFDAIEKEHRLRFVFVGGAAVPLYADRLTFENFNATKDLDVVVSMVSDEDYQRVRRILKLSGLRTDREAGLTPPGDDFPFRWWFEDRFKVDVLSTRYDVGGNVARWFRAAHQGAFRTTLPTGAKLWLADPAAFIAAKLDAFLSPDRGDLSAGKDLADVLKLLATRSALRAEIESSEPSLRDFISTAFKSVWQSSAFRQAITNQFPSQPSQAAAVEEIVSALSGLTKRLW